MSRTVEPPRTVRLSSYYDATAKNSEADYGSFLSLCGEDHYFTTSHRALAMGRLRREIRNNPYLAGLVNKVPESIGFSNLRSRTSSRNYNAKKDLFWYRWKKIVTQCGDSLRTCEEIVIREMLVAGEIFIILLANGKIQLVPSEFCGSPGTNNVPAGLTELNGIQYNAVTNRPAFYRFGKATQGGGLSFADTDSTLVDARFVIHVFHKDRVQMGRGLPWLIPCLRPAHDLYEITRAKTKQIKDANSITGTLEREGASTGNGLGGLTATDGEPTTTAEGPDAPADKANKEPIIIELKPGTFVGLEPGEKLNMLKSDYEASDYKELIFIMLHAISTPVGLPVELWFSGLGDVNYSGFKGIGTQWNARRQYILAFLEDRYLNRLHFWRISKAAKEGDLEANPDADDDLIEWAWRRTAVLDEEKEAKANKTKLESGQESLVDIWEREGKYAEEVLDARRQFWIKLKIAAGELEEGADHSKEKVPIDFLLRNELPGEVTVPHIPDGSGVTSATPATDAATVSAEQRAKKLRAKQTEELADLVTERVVLRLEDLLEKRAA